MEIIKRVFKTPVAIITLLLNLIVGNYILAALSNMDFDSWLHMGPIYSITAVILLTLAFSVITDRYAWWKVSLLGFVVPVAVLTLGSAFLSVEIASGLGFVDVVGRAIVLAVLSIFFGLVFTVPFIIGNTIAFFIYRNALRKNKA